MHGGISNEMIQVADPVLQDSDFEQRQQKVRLALSTLADCQEMIS